MLRLSGPHLPECLRSALKKPELEGGSRQPRVIPVTLDLGSPLGGVEGDLYFWPTSRSYTRQPSAELHLPGAGPILDAALESFCAHGARLAEPGEFTLRAFLAGRIDLTQAEAVLGVIDSLDSRQLSGALQQLAGGVSEPLHRVRNELLELLAHLEAGLDFVEEEIEFISSTDLCEQLGRIADAVEGIAGQLGERDRSVQRARVVLVGATNVGKSTLYNRMAGDGRALVSPQAGTTRDYLTAIADLAGLDVELVDTAGVDADSHGPIDELARQLAEQQHAAAELQLFCLDASRPLAAWERELLDRPAPDRLLVHTKCDLASAPQSESTLGIRTSATTGNGIPELKRAIRAHLADNRSDRPAMVASTADRCRDSLRRCGERLRAAIDLAGDGGGEELVAVELRHALDELGKVVGAVYTDDILDRIFSRFCIGK